MEAIKNILLCQSILILVLAKLRNKLELRNLSWILYNEHLFICSTIESKGILHFLNRWYILWCLYTLLHISFRILKKFSKLKVLMVSDLRLGILLMQLPHIYGVLSYLSLYYYFSTLFLLLSLCLLLLPLCWLVVLNTIISLPTL